ncbi:MAG: universal stress protein [Armatimonadota bacterium]|nr:universal stress protein [Armatimonadota bacterium]
MRILVALDLSVASEALLRFAARLADQIGGELIAMHVYAETDAQAAQQEAGLSLDRFLEHLRAEVGYLLGRAGADARRTRIVIADGAPVDAILERASRDDVDMVVMGTHGRTGISRLLMGSVAEGVLRRAPCPVVVVPYGILVGLVPGSAGRARTS